MSLKLTRLHVQNFKCLRDATFHWHRSTNVTRGSSGGRPCSDRLKTTR